MVVGTLADGHKFGDITGLNTSGLGGLDKAYQDHSKVLKAL